MAGAETYLDLNLLINGGMDAFLLVLTARLLHFPVSWKGVLLGSLIGGIPVILAVTGPQPALTFSKVVVPLLMVRVAFGSMSVRSLSKAFLGFFLVSAGLGGFIQAIWGWVQFDVSPAGTTLALALHNLWFLPLGTFLWWVSQRMWQRWQLQMRHYEANIHELEIDFGEAEKRVHVKALLDTGNNLRDPMTDTPVIILEEAAATAAMPEDLKAFLQLPWREAVDPWPYLLANPQWLKRLVFIPYKGLGVESWLLGVRPRSVWRYTGEERTPVKATVGLVKQNLSREGVYQALLHREHVQEGAEHP